MKSYNTNQNVKIIQMTKEHKHELETNYKCYPLLLTYNKYNYRAKCSINEHFSVNGSKCMDVYSPPSFFVQFITKHPSIYSKLF